MERKSFLKRTISIILVSILFLSAPVYTDTDMAASQTDIVVSTVDEDVAEKLDKLLSNGCAVSLKIKAESESDSKKTLEKLNELTAEANRQGVLFVAEEVKKSDGFYVYDISKDEAIGYKYNVKFCKKLFKIYKKYNYYNDIYKIYSESSYDGGMGDFMEEIISRHETFFFPQEDAPAFEDEGDWSMYCEGGTFCDYGGEDGPHGGNRIIIIGDKENKLHLYGLASDGVTYRLISEDTSQEACEYETKYPFLKQYFNIIKLCSEYSEKEEDWYSVFEKFLYDEYSFLEEHGFDRGRENAIGIALGTEDFGNLSEAMKIFVISSSKYFECHEDSADNQPDIYANIQDFDYLANAYGMTWSRQADYDYRCEYDGMSRRMSKRLFKGTASGVCEEYMYYESFIFNRLGIKTYENSNSKIAHAWTVVKVKNSKGKTLWVPFDYGIGISVVENYKQAFAGIQGAPNKKTYTMDDFN